MSANISYALDNFDHEAARARLSRMFAALSATNEAIMRAKSRAELFELVCEAAANGGKFTSTSIALASPTGFLGDRRRRRADRGKSPARRGSRSARSIRKDAGSAASRSARGSPASATTISPIRAARCFTIRSAATAPDRGRGVPAAQSRQAVGILLFCVRRKGAFTPEFGGSAAAAGRQYRVRARQFRPRRREDQGGRADRISGVA